MLYVHWTCVKNTLDRRYMRIQCCNFFSTHDRRTENWYISTGSFVDRQHSLLVCGTRSTNATHLFVCTVSARKNCISKYLTHENECICQKHAGRARRSSYRRISHGFPLRAPGIRNVPALPCMSARSRRRAHTGCSPSPAFEQQAVTVLFPPLNRWSSKERHLISNHLICFFTRYTTLSAESVFDMAKLSQNV